jgi:hypothetical protein
MNAKTGADWLGLAISLFLLAMAATVVIAVPRIIFTARDEDRRRYVLALLTLVSPPVVLALATRSLVALVRRTGVIPVPELWPIFVSLPAAMALSASAAFVLPFRTTRERALALVGGAIAGFMIYGLLVGH